MSCANLDLQAIYKDNIAPILDGAAMFAEFACDMSYEGGLYLSREFEKITNDMSQEIQRLTGQDVTVLTRIIQKAFNALPAFVVIHYTSFAVRLPLFCYWMYRDMSGQPLSNDTKRNVYAGLALSTGVEAASFLGKIVTYGGIGNLTALIVSVTMTMFWAQQAQQV
jgi:hypothetical protein